MLQHKPIVWHVKTVAGLSDGHANPLFCVCDLHSELCEACCAFEPSSRSLLYSLVSCNYVMCLKATFELWADSLRSAVSML